MNPYLVRQSGDSGERNFRIPNPDKPESKKINNQKILLIPLRTKVLGVQEKISFHFGKNLTHKVLITYNEEENIQESLHGTAMGRYLREVPEGIAADIVGTLLGFSPGTRFYLP